MKLLYHEAKLASLSYILVLRYIYATLQPTRLLMYLLKRLHLHFLHSMHAQDVTLVPSISVPSPQDWGWTSLRGEWRLSCTPLSETIKLSIELVKYARKKGCGQKSDNRERQSKTLFFDYKHSSAWSIKSLGHRNITCYSSIFCQPK